MRTFIMNHEEEMIRLIETLVNIDSGTYVKDGVDEVGKIIKEAYEEIGFETEVEEQEVVGNNIVIRHPEATDPKVFMIAHMDTVFQKGTVAERPFERKGKYAYGPGVMDMKSSQVTTLYALKALLQKGSEAVKNIVLLLNTDEEIGSIYSRKLIEEIASNKKYALILEPAQEGNLVSGRKGGGKYFLKVTGKSAHAGIEPENGVSAIEELSNKVLQLHALTKSDEGIYVNVGLVSGGTSINTIAPFAEAAIDVRVETVQQGIDIDKAIQEICRTPTVLGTTLKLTGKMTRPAWISTSQSLGLKDIIVEEGAKLGLLLADEKSGGGSDGNFTANLGIATIDGLGPVGGNAHQETEYLEVSSLTERSLLLANVLERLSLE